MGYYIPLAQPLTRIKGEKLTIFTDSTFLPLFLYTIPSILFARTRHRWQADCEVVSMILA